MSSRIGPVAAAVIIAEIGVEMTRFPTPGHLCSWAKFAPGVKASAGKNKGNGSTWAWRCCVRAAGRDYGSDGQVEDLRRTTPPLANGTCQRVAGLERLYHCAEATAHAPS